MHASNASSLNETCGGRSQPLHSGSGGLTAHLGGPAGLEVSGNSSRLCCPWWSTYSEVLEQMLAYRAPWLPASGIRCGHTQLRDEHPAGGQALTLGLQNNCRTLQGDAVGAWISEKICAVVFPTPETIRKVGA